MVEAISSARTAEELARLRELARVHYIGRMLEELQDRLDARLSELARQRTTE